MNITGRLKDLAVGDSGVMDPKVFTWCLPNEERDEIDSLWADWEDSVNYTGEDGIPVTRTEGGFAATIPTNYKEVLHWDDLDVDLARSNGDPECTDLVIR